MNFREYARYFTGKTLERRALFINGGSDEVREVS